MVLFHHNSLCNTPWLRHAYAVICIIRLTNIARPRPLDALWDMLPPNPLRNLVNAVGPDDERAQQAHRPAAVGAVDRFNLDRVQLGHHHDHRDMFRRPQEANHQAPQVDREARVIAAGLRLQEANRDYLEFRQQRRDMRRLQRLEADGAQVEGLLQRDAEAYVEARRTVVAERRRDRAPAAVPALRARRPHAP
jgi:hypothetical protein